jgi:photosystem II stability/assembly factor-like uncharacterized protein
VSPDWRSVMVRWSPVALSLLLLIPLSALVDSTRPTLTPERQRARARVIERLKTKEKKPYDQPNQAVAFYWSKRSPTGAALDPSEVPDVSDAVAAVPVFSPSRGDAIAHHTDVALSASTADGSASGALDSGWQALGPGNVGGRSRTLLIHDKKPHLMWTAGVAGGIWKSTDQGASWQPKGDLLVNIAVNSMIQDPMLDNVLYAGTGEGFFNVNAVRGRGILKSADYGETWAQLPATDTAEFFYVQKLAATRHKKKQRIYAATGTGIHRSSDFGATWTKVLDATAVNGCFDLAIQHKQNDDVEETLPKYVFASCGSFAQATVWRAADVDDNQLWEPVLREVDMGRTSVAISPSDPSVIYALASFYQIPPPPLPPPNPVLPPHPQNFGLLGVYRSTANGAPGSWERRVHYTDPAKINTVQLSNPVFSFFADCQFGPISQPFSQGWFDNQIAVDPKNPDVVWTAGIDLMRSDDGGASWGIASYWWFDGDDPNYAHADSHAITFHPKYNASNNRQMFVAGDGGIHRTDDARAPVGQTLAAVCGEPVEGQVTWTSLNNGYQVTQFYHGAVYPDGERFFGGTQDNGVLRGGASTGQNWSEILGGDGGYVAVHRADPNILFAENTAKSLQRSLDGGDTWAPIHTGVTESEANFQFIHPFAMDPVTSDRLWYGGAFIWRSNNRGTTWLPVSQFLGARIAAFGIAPSDPNRVYVGVQHVADPAASGRIFTTFRGTQLTAFAFWASARPRQGYVSSIAVDPTAPLVAYATYSTFDFGNNVGHVFKTINGGLTWTRIDGSLPDIPVHSVVVHPTRPNTLFIGTDLGAFVTVDGGTTWLRENIGFANVIVEHLEISNGRLFAFTHGRSVYSARLAP